MMLKRSVKHPRHGTANRADESEAGGAEGTAGEEVAGSGHGSQTACPLLIKSADLTCQNTRTAVK